MRNEIRQIILFIYACISIQLTKNFIIKNVKNIKRQSSKKEEGNLTSEKIVNSVQF